MVKTRLERLEQLHRQSEAPPALLAILERLKAQQGDTTHTPPTLTDTLGEIIDRLPS